MSLRNRNNIKVLSYQLQKPDNSGLYRVLFWVAFASIMFVTGMFAQTTVYIEDFNGYDNKTEQSNKWFTITDGCNVASKNGSFEVINGALNATNVNCEAIWASSVIDISDQTVVTAQLSITNIGNFENDDLVRVYYRVDEGPELPFSTANVSSNIWSQTGIKGNSLQLVVKVINDHKNETVIIDDVLVSVGGSIVENPIPEQTKTIPNGQFHLASLAVDSKEEKVAIQWTTSKEENTSQYYIERSLDGRDFEVIAVLPAKGSTNETSSYSGYDFEPHLGNSYYRIQQKHENGTKLFSDIITVTITTTLVAEMIITPNPNKGIFTLDIAAKKNEVNVLIMNNFGQLVHVEEITGIDERLTVEMDVSQTLPAGVYYVKMDVEDNSFIKKIVIE